MRQTFPLDLLVLDRTLDEPLHRQLYRRLRGMIEARELPPGFEIPSTRTLAGDLGLARNTVISAYDQLVTEGFLLNRNSARPVVVGLPERRTAAAARNCDQPLLSRRGEVLASQRVHHGAPGQFAFHPGMPDTGSFPYREWGRLLSRRAVNDGERLFGTYSITGLPALREAISDYLRGARGVKCRPEQIVVTTGAQASFDLLARLLLDPGDRVWMEEPGYYGAQSVFTSAGAELLPLEVDEGGWRLDLPPDASPRMIFVTPACQHPYGVTMSIEQRHRLFDIAHRHNAWIIEDDYDGEYRFDGRPVPSLQGMDIDGRVIYVGTFAKIMFPALRLGYIVVPDMLTERIPNALSTTGQFAPLLLQAAVADFIAEGLMTRHLRRMRRLYAQRRRFFVERCRSELAPWLKVLEQGAGIQMVGLLADGLDDLHIATLAARRALNISPLSKYYSFAASQKGLVLGYAACSESEINRGISRLKDVFSAA